MFPSRSRVLPFVPFLTAAAPGVKHNRSEIKRVHFYWVNRDKEAFEWFSGLLSELEANNVNNFLEINVYLTAPVSKEADIKKLMQMEEGGECTARAVLSWPSPHAMCGQRKTL